MYLSCFTRFVCRKSEGGKLVDVINWGGEPTIDAFYRGAPPVHLSLTWCGKACRVLGFGFLELYPWLWTVLRLAILESHDRPEHRRQMRTGKVWSGGEGRKKRPEIRSTKAVYGTTTISCRDLQNNEVTARSAHHFSGLLLGFPNVG